MNKIPHIIIQNVSKNVMDLDLVISTINAICKKKICENLGKYEDLEEQRLLLKLNEEARAELIEQHNKAFNLMNTIPLKGNEELFGYVGGVMQTLGYLIGELDRTESED